jgi:hypothetical protein
MKSPAKNKISQKLWQKAMNLKIKGKIHKDLSK